MTAAWPGRIRRLLAANRSEIAIRVFRAATELGIQTVAIYAEEDKLSLAPVQGRRGVPSAAARAARSLSRRRRGDPGRGRARGGRDPPGLRLPSESPEFAEACAAGIVSSACRPRPCARSATRWRAQPRGLGGRPGHARDRPVPDDPAEIRRLAAEVGYPVMLKASWGGGGRGMRPIEREEQLLDAVLTAKREAKAAFGKDEVYLEKLVRRAARRGPAPGRHPRQPGPPVRARLLDPAPAPEGDRTRARSLPRRGTRAALCEAALKIGRATNYVGAGTVEFLMDADTGGFYFIEVNPRIQVEHTVTGGRPGSTS